MLLMLMAVAVGGAMLLYLALRVPAFSAEIYAYLGQTQPPVDVDESRRAHLFFLLYLYAAPLGLGILLHGLHALTRRYSQWAETKPDSDEFEMTG